MLPTLCHVAEAAVPAEAAPDGEDLAAPMLGESARERTRPLFWEPERKDQFAKPARQRDRSPSLAVRDGRWKLLTNAKGSDIELYDLATDEKETHNVAEEHPEAAKRLTAMTLEWRRSLP